MKTCVSDNVHTFGSKCPRKEFKTMLLNIFSLCYWIQSFEYFTMAFLHIVCLLSFAFIVYCLQ